MKSPRAAKVLLSLIFFSMLMYVVFQLLTWKFSYTRYYFYSDPATHPQVLINKQGIGFYLNQESCERSPQEVPQEIVEKAEGFEVHWLCRKACFFENGVLECSGSNSP